MATLGTWIPNKDELTVPAEINMTEPYLRAGARHMWATCEAKCHEFMLCRKEEEDPRKCLKEGKDVTNCGVSFLQKVKKSCPESFTALGRCIEYQGGGRLQPTRCKAEQRVFDRCAWEKLGVERPRDGILSKHHIHQSNRPKPASKGRDYEAEAAAITQKLPSKEELNRSEYGVWRSDPAIRLFDDV